MPPVTTGPPPTTGNVAMIYWSGIIAVMILVVIIGFLKYTRPSGKAKQDKKERSENKAIEILQEQVAEMRKSHASAIAELKESHASDMDAMKKVQQEQKTKIEALEKARDFDREARHALMNRLQAAFGYGDVYYQTLHEIIASWKEMPPHLVDRINGMKRISEIVEKYPMPTQH